jgi:hypothetical protein
VISSSSSSSSSDGTNFKNIYTGNSSRLAIPEKYDFSDIAARYIRITVNGNTDNNAAAINDIKLYGYDQDKPMSTSNSCKKLPMTMTGIVGSVGDKQKELLQMLYYNSTKLAKLGRTEIRANIEN